MKKSKHDTVVRIP